jgi:tetratricopeptide (TPR) repeat protein
VRISEQGYRHHLTPALGVYVLIAVLSFSLPAFAMGDEPSKPPSTSKPAKGCPDGYKYNKKTKQCVKIACATGEIWSHGAASCTAITAAAVSDDDLRVQGIWLAKNGRYAEALEVLRLVKQQNDPRVLNYIGYSTRKLGRVDEGISYYMQALALDPNYHVVREYLGEGYLQQGRPELAKLQLIELQNRCGKDCIEYRTLEAALDNKMAPAQW